MGWRFPAKCMISALLVSVSIADVAVGQSLAGNEGDVRRKPFFAGGGTGGCEGGYKRYVAARGHSAYASTPYGSFVEHVVCGWSVNVGSQKAAEAQALKSCEAGRKKYKVGMLSRCSLFASK